MLLWDPAERSGSQGGMWTHPWLQEREERHVDGMDACKDDREHTPYPFRGLWTDSSVLYKLALSPHLSE